MELEFDPDAHVYKHDGRVVPSVTGIISSLYDFRYVDPDTLSAAAEFGTAVHRACELRDLNTLDVESLSSPLVPYLAGWERFLSEMRVKVLQVEKQYLHRTMGYAGTIDRLLEIDGKHWLADIKAVSRLTPPVAIQLAGYQGMLAANNPEYAKAGRAAVQLRADGTYMFKTYSDPMDWPVFVSLLTLHSWRKKNAA